MNLQENIKRILREVRVPRNERVELYKDENIIVVVPLTHRALQKYAHQCQWCINSDLDEWEDYHKGKHAVIIQRNPKKPKIGIKYPIPSEIFTIEHYTDIDSIYNILGYRFSSNEERDDYMDEVTSNIDNFATNIVYYSPSDSLYDQEDNYLPAYGYSISDIPNVTPEVIKIMDDYLQENEEMSIQESIRRILREDQDRREKLKLKIINVIKHIGLDYAISMVGGIEKLLDILNVKDVFQFLNLFKDMETEYDQDDDFLMFRFREGLNYFGVSGGNLYVNDNILKVILHIENNDWFYVDLFIVRWFLTTYNISIKHVYKINN